MYTNKLVTAQEVKSIFPIVNNEIDNTLVDSAILLTQDTLLKSSLTLDMWEDIMTNSGTTANTYLINNFLKNLIAYGVAANLVVMLSYQLNSSGLRLKTSDHSTLAESADITNYRTYIQGFIDNIRRVMEEYIEDNSSSYPKYFIYEDGKKPTINNFKIGRVGGADKTILPGEVEDCIYWKTR